MLNSNEVALGATALTSLESTGGVCPSYFGDRRRQQLPADWPSPINRFMAVPPVSAKRTPSPSSASRPFRSRSASSRHHDGDATAATAA